MSLEMTGALPVHGLHGLHGWVLSDLLFNHCKPAA
jgi:hypothetical protein